METYYRPICDADDYDTVKYGGFVELQNTRIKDGMLRSRTIGRTASIAVCGAKEDSNTEFAEKQSHREPLRNRSALRAKRLGGLLGGSRWLCFSANSVRNLAFVPAHPVLGHSPDCPVLRGGFTLKHFAEWIKNSNIGNLNQARQLPRVLADKRARDVFVGLVGLH